MEKKLRSQAKLKSDNEIDRFWFSLQNLMAKRKTGK